MLLELLETHQERIERMERWLRLRPEQLLLVEESLEESFASGQRAPEAEVKPIGPMEHSSAPHCAQLSLSYPSIYELL